MCPSSCPSLPSSRFLTRWGVDVAVSWRRRAEVEAGFRNFVSSMEDFLLHFSVREYLGGTYHITDPSKGAMLVRRAGVARTERYDRWYGLLLEEVDIVGAPGAIIISVGSAVARRYGALP
jgi:hypothetical protein